MSSTTITVMPTMCTPEKLDQKELIAQVNYLQDEIIRQGQKLHEVKGKLAETCIFANLLADHLWTLVDAFDAGSEAQISDHLKMLSETRQRERGQKARVH